MYQAILFDLDDTLYDLRSYWRGRLWRALDMARAGLPELDHEVLLRTAMDERVYMEQWPDFLRRQGVADEALIAATHDAFQRDWFEQMELYDDTIHTLESLRRRYRLGLITNGPASIQRAKIERFGLAGYFDALIVSGEVGVAKPDPAIFALALRQLGVAPRDALFVGDSPEHDMRGAEAAGMAFVWMNAHGEELPDGFGQPLAVIGRLGELMEVLGEIGPVVQ
jgi:putative hydrolase of the HAD superfamily